MHASLRSWLPIATLLAVVVTLTASAHAGGSLVIQHEGMTTPGTEGFTGFRTNIYPYDPKAGYFVSDYGHTTGGYDAWHLDIFGAKVVHGYFHPLSNSQQQHLQAHGGTLTMTARPVTNQGLATFTSGAGVLFGGRRYHLALGVDGNDLFASLLTSQYVTPDYLIDGAGLGVQLAGQANAFHTYDLRIDPLTGLADLSIDGISQISGYAGYTDADAFLPAGFYFGVGNGGAADFASVRLQSVPEPSSLALMSLGALAALVCFRRRTVRAD